MLTVLKKLGLSDKEIRVYGALLSLGSGAVRQVALAAKVNRGTTYDILRDLRERGLVNFLGQGSRRVFTAEDPEHLKTLIAHEQERLQEAAVELDEHLPALRSLHARGGAKPVVRYFEGKRGIRTLLGDVLRVMGVSPEKLYFVYSSSAIREHYHAAYPTFTAERIKKKIRVRVIAMGSGGDTKGLDERKWLTQKESSPTYTLIYRGHVAHIALDSSGQLVGVIIENEALYQSEKMIFAALWQKL